MERVTGNGTTSAHVTRPEDKTTHNIINVGSLGTDDFNATLTQTTPEDVIDILALNGSADPFGSTSTGSRPGSGLNQPQQQQPPAKKQRLESLHSKSSVQSPWNRGAVAGVPTSFPSYGKPEVTTREVISLSSSEDEDNSSSDDDIEVLDENEAAKVSWKNTSFDQQQQQHPNLEVVQVGSSSMHQPLAPKFEQAGDGTKQPHGGFANIVPAFEQKGHTGGRPASNGAHQPGFQAPQPPPPPQVYRIPGAFPGSSAPQQQPKQEAGGSDDLQVLNSRYVQNNPYPFLIYNTPAPVPHAGSMNVKEEKRQDLQRREQTKRQELVQWEQQKQKVVHQISVAKRAHDKKTKDIADVSKALKRALALGNHNEVTKYRVELQARSKEQKTAKDNVNQGTRILMKLEQAVRLVQNEIFNISNSIRLLGHAVNASFNPYEAQIFNDSLRNTAPVRRAVEDLDLKNLIDNIRPDEESEEGLENTPPELSVTLLKHQRMGLTWMKRMEASKSKGGILADDMGLGKTIQTLSLMMANKSEDEECKTNLIIAPVSLLRQWAAEIESKTRPHVYISVGIYHSDEKKKMTSFELMSQYDVVLVSYTTLSLEWKKHFYHELEANKNEDRTFMPKAAKGGQSYTSPFFAKEANFHRIILDEAQAIKNKLALASRAVTYLKATYRFCLTGTPMQNSIEELYPIIRFLKIQPYCVEQKFRADIVTPIKSNTDLYDEFDVKKSMRKLRALLKAILLRRTKDSLIDGQPILNLPEKHVMSDYVTLESEELDYYQSIEEGVQKVARKMMASNIRSGGVLTLLLRLRQACCHSYLVEIGQYKAKMKRDDEAAGKLNVSGNQMLANTQDMKPEVKNKVLEMSAAASSTDLVQADDAMLTCPVCFDALDFESPLLIFGECGHMVCKSCAPGFFQESDDEEGLKNRSRECLECKRKVKEQNMLEYILFKKVHIEQLNSSDLRQFCYQHYLAKVKSNQVLIREFVKRDEGFEPSAKIQKCVELIQEIGRANPSEKVIVFSQFTTLFDLLRLVLHNQNIPFLRYDGTLSVENKNTVIKEFYKSDTKVLLLSLRSGNAGLTLTCANHVIIMDPFWNPYVEEQAMGRAHRIGQEREVHVHRVLIQGTVESRIMELQDHKKQLIGEALDEGQMKSISQLDRRELGFLFGLNSLTNEELQG
ncbi:ATP-dependent helicase ULS1 [Candida viswanathii]|uniref:ATP-dependent helicase ULS1 n=1 Tax=Candida viswanathii TaxID=5486 RepID=A0A367XZP1_9ASCO|nr:ATP-dependent helicase ULS1 [Candida viswanathii]